MNIMELGAIGELVGGVAVIGSLLYVGLQVRQSNTQSRQRDEIERAESHRAQSRDGNALFLPLTNPDLANVFRRGVNDFASLTKDEQGQLDWWLMTYTIHAESIAVVEESGFVDSIWAERWVVFLVSILKSPGGAQWWSKTKPRFVPAFVDRIEKLTSRADSPPAVTDATPWFAGDPPAGS